MAYFKKKSNGWIEHIEDIAFQKLVVSKAYPDYTTKTCLFVPDKDKRNTIAEMKNWFSVEDDLSTTYSLPTVVFSGDAEALSRSNFMTLVDVAALVDEFTPAIDAEIPAYLDSMVRNERIPVPISALCKDCEYKRTDAVHQESGFEICWGDMAHAKPHILELGQLGNFNRRGQIDALISAGKSSLYDVPTHLVEGKYHNRPFYQVTRQREILKPEFFDDVLAGLQYPLHFIDFETTQSAVPFYSGMRPYDNVLFQWSCHTKPAPGAPLEHNEWLHDDEANPNVAFGRTLMCCVGNTGTLMTWSHYENTQLAYLYRNLGDTGIDEPELTAWLLRTARINGHGGDRILDLNDVAERYYFHPAMGGRTSIKVTQPAVLSAPVSGRIRACG